MFYLTSIEFWRVHRNWRCRAPVQSDHKPSTTTTTTKSPKPTTTETHKSSNTKVTIMRLGTAASSLHILTPEEVLVRGFELIAGLPVIEEQSCWTPRNIGLFKSFFGPSPTTVSFVWNDIVTITDIDFGITESEKDAKGFKKFLRALHFLWAYPKNADILAYTTGTTKRMVEGENLWTWVKVIGRLKVKVISWPEDEYKRADRFILLTVDGVDCRTYEKSTDEMNVDPAQFTHKHNHGGVKYEIGIDCYESKIVWISGPHRGGKHDRTIFAEGLRDKIPEGKVVISDRVYTDKKRNDNADLALPCIGDSQELFNFKARAKARHESLNGRLKDFRILFDTYHHPHGNHVFAFEAVAVLVQYAMDHGHPIFDANTGDIIE